MIQKARLVLEVIYDVDDPRLRYVLPLHNPEGMFFMYGESQVLNEEKDAWRTLVQVVVPISSSLFESGRQMNITRMICDHVIEAVEVEHYKHKDTLDASFLYSCIERPEVFVQKMERELKFAAKDTRPDIPPTLIGEEDGGKSLL